METVLQVSGLTKRYGHTVAVQSLDLSVPAGSVYGILGPNGSGKTSTLGMVLGVLPPGKGSYSWFDRGSGHQLRTRIGALLEQPNFYPGMSARQNLRLAAGIKDIHAPQIDRLLEIAGLSQWKNMKFAAFSTGMKQRLGIASTLLGDPDVLVLDEPTNGLDPEGIADVRRLIREFAAGNKTVILASHLLGEVQKLCTHVAVLKSGKKIFDGAVGKLLSQGGGITIGAGDKEGLVQVLGEYPGLASIREKDEMVVVRLSGDYKINDLTAFLIHRGVQITHISEDAGSLEQEFIKLLSQ